MAQLSKRYAHSKVELIKIKSRNCLPFHSIIHRNGCSLTIQLPIISPSSESWPSDDAALLAAALVRQLHRWKYSWSNPPSCVSTEDCWQLAISKMEQERKIREKIGLSINQRYKVSLRISFGTYGSIYSAYDIYTGQDFAVKFVMGSNNNAVLQLQHEFDVYNALKGLPGIPKIHWFGYQFDNQILVLQLLGPSLAQLYNYCDRWFSRETTSRIGLQMLDRLKSLHLNGYVHRDVKPENFLMGLGDDEETCYIIDFGLVRRYRISGHFGKHIPLRKGGNLVGTAKYASISSHKGLTLSRRDDLESLGYVLVEFINRTLPWSEQEGRKKRNRISKEQLFKRILVKKESVNWASTCPELAQWITYCTKLGFTDEPDYDYLKSVLQSLSTSRQMNDEEIRQQTIQNLNQFISTGKHAMLDSGFYNSKSISGNYDDGTKRYSWIMRRESNVKEKNTFDCLYRWTTKGKKVRNDQSC